MTAVQSLDPWGEDRPLTARNWVFDIILGLLPIALSLPAGNRHFSVAILVGIAVAVRRRWLMLSVALLTIAGIWQVVTGDINYGADIFYCLVTFRLGAHRDPRTRRLGLVFCAVVVAGAAGWTALQPAVGGSDWWRHAGAAAIMAGLSALVVFGGWLTGYVRYQRREVIRDRVAVQLQSAEERRLRDLIDQQQQRIAIASDMHDVVAHSWAVVAAQADGARYLLRTEPDRAEEALSVIGETARSAMTDIRGLLSRLRDDSGGEVPLSLDEPEQLIARLRDAGVSLQVHREGTPTADPTLRATTSRILTESLTNALKHGDLRSPVQVAEDWTGGYRLTVSNAAGARPVGKGGHGLRGMRERVDACGGSMTAAATDDGNLWQLDVFIPEGSHS